MIRQVTLMLVLLFSFQFGSGQDYFRIKADFSVKVKKSDGKMNLTMGKVYYDKNFKELIYDITFPQAEKWIIADTSLVIFRKDTLSERSTIPSINEFTVFHLSLNSNLNDFGLKNSVYKISKVEKKDSLVLSYWKIPKQASKLLDFVVVAKKENRLESVVMFGDKATILSRQFFRNYITIGSFEFPGQIVQIIYDKDGKENYQVTEFRNVKVNDLENSGLYHFTFNTTKK